MLREEIAFFDVDHTVSRRATALAFVIVCIKRRYVKWWYLLGAPVLFIFYRFFNVQMESLYRMSLPVLKGLSRSELESIGQEAFSKYLINNLYSGALSEIERLRSRGVRVILATSTPFEAVYPLALHCGISAADIISTQFSYTGGLFDGKLVGKPVFSRYKSAIIGEFVGRSGTDFQFCSFYSDSIHDLPLLEMVGHPVAANPDLRLRRLAKKRGWTIKDFSA